MSSLFGQYRGDHIYGSHICGLYYSVTCGGRLLKTYLPQVELQAHATILATTSRTVLTQTFVNPDTEKGIREVRYTFPLYEGVSVVGFTCHIGDRTIIGEVKEREKARAVFKEAVAKGQTAGLFEQLPEASDVFTTTIGNIPPGARVIIKITYLGELKHDMEVDGIRFTIPNIICPRYGNYPGELRTTLDTNAMDNGISITVDADMADGSFIQKMQSPTHPIAMTMGTTSLAPNAEPTMTKASATLTLGTAGLEKDFVLQIIAKNTGIPRAILENHPTIPNHQALMATLVPKFALPPEKPELVFVCDRSGSMAGSRITLVIQALKVFLKSLPLGVKFNICSFGSSHSFLWEKSVTYSQQTLEDAINYADSFTANYGGTEMLTPLKATIDQRYKDMPLDIMVLTDGETWNQHALFSYLNESVIESKAPIRLFTLGIGNGVSHALIEGIAKAGNGFSQTVGEGEKMDTKVVRMLKGALSPHVNDYTLEVKYNNTTLEEADENFEIIEKVADSLKVSLNLGNEKKKQAEMKKLILLFDPSADPDMEDPLTYDESGEQKYTHLPKIVTPKIIQAPQNVPSLFAFNRTTVYLLLGPDAPKATPKSVVLRGTSVHGPLELEIPIQIMDQPGETIHQLAAKKVISELEAGRGWLSEAKDDAGTLVKKSFEGRFSDMVEREAVRLGIMFQVGGKWCSFVAVEADQKTDQEKAKETEGWKWIEDEEKEKSVIARGGLAQIQQETQRNYAMMLQQQAAQTYGQAQSYVPTSSSYVPANQKPHETFGGVSSWGGKTMLSGAKNPFANQPNAPSNVFGAVAQPSNNLFGQAFGSTAPSALFGSPQHSNVPPPGAHRPSGGLFSATPAFCTASQMAQQQQQQAFFANSQAPSMLPQSFSGQPNAGPAENSALADYQMQLMILEQQNKNRRLMARQENLPAMSSPPYVLPAPPASTNSPFGNTAPPTSGLFGAAAPQISGSAATLFGSSSPSGSSALFGASAQSEPSVPNRSSVLFGSPAPDSSVVISKTPEDLTLHLISLQSFEGFWDTAPSLLASLQLQRPTLQSECSKAGVDEKVFVTALVIAVFEQKLKAHEGSWELVVEKAKAWLVHQGVGGVDELVAKAGVMVK